ncbi:MAG: type II toxin-antitoxin system RelE/ParE family toxin [Rhodospirillales bacterium]
MIKPFKHRGLQKLYEQGDGRKLPPELLSRIEEILGLLDVAATPEDMDLPQLRLHPLKGKRAGQWAATVRANWRIVFRFDDEPKEVDFVDYH